MKFRLAAMAGLGTLLTACVSDLPPPRVRTGPTLEQTATWTPRQRCRYIMVDPWISEASKATLAQREEASKTQCDSLPG
jgi:hypothetical protein